jgi:hypothetical protein
LLHLLNQVFVWIEAARAQARSLNWRSPHNRAAARLIAITWVTSLIFVVGAVAGAASDPTISTQSSKNGQIQTGTAVTDEATVDAQGSPKPTGTVSFFLCGPNASAASCTSGGSPIGGAVTLGSNKKAESASTSPTAAGHYCWRAEYSGDGSFNSKTHTNTTTECFEVLVPAKTDPAISTESKPNGKVQAGDSVKDEADVSGSPSNKPTGTVSFYLCGPTVAATSCTSGGTAVGGAVSLSASGKAESASTSRTDPGFYCWRAVYEGDASYNSATHSNSTTECFEIEAAVVQTPAAQVDPDISTVSTPNGNVQPGHSVTDRASVSGPPGNGPDPTGTVTFWLCGPNQAAASCTSGGTQIGGSVAQGNNKKWESDSASPTVEGYYCWRAQYSGDSNYNSANHSNDNTECFQVKDSGGGSGQGGANVDPDLSTTSSEQGTIQPGTSVTDHVIVDGSRGRSKGDVIFYLCGPGATNGCHSEDSSIKKSEKTLDKDGEATSDSVSPTAAGRYCWRVKYISDQSKYNDISHTNNTTECFTVAGSSATSAGTTTTVLGAQVTAGSGGAGTTTAAEQLPKTGTPIPILPAIILAINLLASGGMIRKLAILEELDKNEVGTQSD